MSTFTICDRCRSVIEKPHTDRVTVSFQDLEPPKDAPVDERPKVSFSSLLFSTAEPGPIRTGKSVDLCRPCAKDLLDHIENSLPGVTQ